MAKPTEAVDRAAFLKALNKSVEEQESFTDALRQARDIVARTMLGGSMQAVRQHRPRRRRSKTGGSRTQMIKTILANAPNPVSVDEIVAEMAKHGVNDPKNLVSSTLSYLKRTDQAKNPERGLWVSVTESVAVAA